VAKQPETLLKEKVLSDLKSLSNTHAVKIQQVGIRGIPDILACIAGWFVAIELKRDSTQNPEPLQKYQLKKIEKAGGFSYVVHPGNWPLVFEELRVISLT